ncbi:MAG: hypothetical protein GF344_01355 [Chitinivibrionales bacterium]|nr:hypothetical protein [Chitinivibrionales bacterium]MBD3355742.1 hypothetical protein [Chitinivibrionales bacterium]
MGKPYPNIPDFIRLLSPIIIAGVATTGAPVHAAAFDTLAGPLPSLVKYRRTPYVVIADIQVPPDKVVTIEPGVVLLFKNFTGIHVEGRLVAEGTAEKPIVFTSELDRKHNPTSSLLANPYDWNGIYIHSDAFGTSLAHCKVLYSVYGVISDTKFIKVSPGLFAHNGKSSFVIEGVEQDVGDEPYSYVLSTKDATIDGVPIKILRDPLAMRRTVVRYAGLTAILGGCSIGVSRLIQYQQTKDRLEELSVGDTTNTLHNEGRDWEDTRRRRNQHATWSALGFAIGLLGTVGITWTFTF